MGQSIDVQSDTFDQAVLAASHQQPVLVDFFATWCGPCKMLKPLLEQLVQEYEFILAKVDIDQNPDLAQTYGVEGVPDVRVVVNGEVKPGFVGMLAEPQIRERLAQLNLTSALQDGLAAAKAAIAAHQLDDAKRRFGQLIERYPQSQELAIAAAKFLISQDKWTSAEKLLSFIQEQERGYFAQAKALRELSQLKPDTDAPAHPLDQPFFQAVQHIWAEDEETALQGLLSILSQDRKYRNDGARKTMLLIFDLLGDDHPLTKYYRKQLTLTLY